MVKELTPEEKEARRALQSKVGKSNVRRSKDHERRIAKLLTGWAGVDFRRRRVEGRDSTVIERESTADVIPVKGEILFSIEAKCGVVTSLDGLLANPGGCMFTQWWHQASYDACLLSKVFNRQFYPLMFFKPHPNFDWIAISQQAVPHLRYKNGLALSLDALKIPHIGFDAYRWTGPISCNVVRTKKKENFKFVPLDLDPLLMIRWYDFANHVDPQSIFYQNSGGG